MGILWRLLRNLFVNGMRLLRNALVAIFGRRGVEYVRFELKGNLPLRRARRGPPRLLRRFFPPPPPLTIEELERRLTRIEADPRVRGVVLSVRGLHLGWGDLVPLRARLAALRERGKELIVFLREAGNHEYYLASAASKIVTAPAGSIGLTGLVAEVRFYKEALEKLSAEAEVVAAGKYKSAFDPYTRTEMTPAHREAIEAILDDLSGVLVRAIAHGRELTPEKVREVIDEGPYNAERAKERGLIDDIGYEDELEKLLGQGKKPRMAESAAYERSGRRAYDWRPLFGERGIGYLQLSGIIHTGESTRMPARAPTAGDETICKAIEALRKNRRVRAVVLHVDSRGGSGLASDLMWRALGKLRAEKPVVAYLGNVAASGGYYVACAADHIVATAGTLTGSIGVLAGKINIGALLGRLGVRTEVVKRGESADVSSAIRGFTAAERDRLERDVRYFYDDFVSKVAESRKLPREDVAESAEGRVWSGTRALERKLVDELGSFATAVAWARAKAKLPERAPVWTVGREVTMPSLSAMGLGAFAPLTEPLGELAGLALLGDEAWVALAPFEVRFR